jgi:dTDP-glucose pyrophosphorylase
MEKLKKFLIKPDISINQALKQMDESAKKILFVVDKNRKLLGTVTDGDIRRWILKRGSLNKSISNAMNKNPICLKKEYPSEEAKDLMTTKKIDCIPIVDHNKRIVSAVWWSDLLEAKQKKHKKINLPVVIMAGGEGTRLFPFTKVLPKALIQIGEKTILEQIINKFVEYGCKNFYLSVNYKASLIKAYFNDIKCNCSINYIQEEKPLGTAGSLHLLKNKVNSSLFVTNCDTLIEADYSDILKYHRANKNEITVVSSIKYFIIPYGVCEIGNNGNLVMIREKPENNFLVNAGLYILEPEILNDIPPNKFYQITDLINDCIKKDKKIGVYPVSESSWFDIGQWKELQAILK